MIGPELKRYRYLVDKGDGRTFKEDVELTGIRVADHENYTDVCLWGVCRDPKMPHAHLCAQHQLVWMANREET